jgi:hypothetical protein
VRPVAVLDANVLIPPGLRDLLLSGAHVGVFRPVWQDEIENEVRRNGARLIVKKYGLNEDAALVRMDYTLGQMNTAFPDARAATRLWAPLVPAMTCEDKDRHVLAVAVGTEATHLVTTNTRDFPIRSRPASLKVQRAERFLRDRLAETPDLVVAAIESMSARMTNPQQTPIQIAQAIAAGEHTPRFGSELLEVLGAS